ncbi:cytochrome P460 family protein [Bosea sp. Root670]|uniref:cytochrome P460 family protein n=1 Tax=Bosea sp. Root670 TaxID=1736583 RepID=UPI0009E9D084
MGAGHAPELRTGDWEFQWFNPDRSTKAGENLGRCRSCHVGQAANDFVFTADRMKAARQDGGPEARHAGKVIAWVARSSSAITQLDRS